MNSATLSAWSLVLLGAIGGLTTALVSKAAAGLLKGRSIKDVVDSANAIIEMNKNHVDALEAKVASLEQEISSLRSKLEETLTANAALQKLLLASPAMTLQPQVKPGE